MSTKKIVAAGFTMIELLVSVSIFLVITLIVLYNYGNFNDDLVVSNLAYEVALEVRTAQVYGLSVLGTKSSAGYDFDAGYGVHFDFNPTNPAGNNAFYLFVDTHGDGMLKDVQDGGGNWTSFDGNCVGPANGGECLEKVTLQGNDVIQKFCTTVDDTGVCSTTGDSPNAGYPASLDITFKRPNPDANVMLNELGTGAITPPQYKNAKIYLSSANAKTVKIVTIDQSGQISVQ